MEVFGLVIGRFVDCGVVGFIFGWYCGYFIVYLFGFYFVYVF